MKKLIWSAALVLALLLKTDFLPAQEGQPPLHGISAKVLFIDFYTPNSVDDFKMSNGLEIAYLRSLHPNFNLALPLKIGIANLAGEDEKATFFSLDAVAQYQFAKPENRVLPYVFAGLGIVFEKLDGGNAQNTQVPLGLGLFYKVGGSSFFTAQAEYRKSFSDLRDNLQLGIGWHFKLKPAAPSGDVITDTDADGLPDAQDHCPNEAGTLDANGCPDTDGDGVANGEDDCPVEKGLEKFNGCPDTDGDGLADAKDDCPTVAGSSDNNGCPFAGDRDGDGVADHADKCPDQAGVLANEGCPQKTTTEMAPANQLVNADADQDGILDQDDRCPNQAGKAIMQGCPDSDLDGIADQDDRCPDEPGLAAQNGCPKRDSDNDGVTDDSDECPNQPGNTATQGCPDSDGDGFSENKDECPWQSGTVKGCPDADKDGIADKDDRCPAEPGKADRQGCPEKDTDADGVFDTADACPNERGLPALQGCPDADRDGIADKDDKCPNDAGPADRKGCPQKDSDQDGFLDDEDRCPNEPGSGTAQGCPDTDGDSVADKEDKCPRTFGKFNGCPDTDGDGIDDGSDTCPTLAGVASAKGCPDQDGDAVADKEDKCPDEAGTNQGCPDIKKEDKEFLTLAAKNVQFETGRATMKAQSYAILDRVAEILKAYPRYDLAIGGHTDNVGEAAANLRLSEERAKACYEYLLARQVPANRMTHKGYGKTQPIAENNTEQGREANRRVEFNLRLR